MERSQKINTSLLTGAIGFSLLLHIAVAISVMNIEIPKVTTRAHFEEWVRDISPTKRKAVILPPSVKEVPKASPMVSGTASGSAGEAGNNTSNSGDGGNSDGKGTDKSKGQPEAKIVGSGGSGSGGSSARTGALRSSGVLGLIGSKSGDVGNVFSANTGPVVAEGKGSGTTGGSGGGSGTGTVISRQGLKGSGYGGGSGGGPADINQIATASSGRVESGQRQGSALPTPRVTGSGGGTVSGNVDSQGVLSVITRKNSSFTRCYERALKANPDLAGKLGYEISVSEEGQVLDVKFIENTLRAPDVMDCVKSILLRLSFPKPKGGPAIFSSVLVFGTV
jgi:hypothetical protein